MRRALFRIAAILMAYIYLVALVFTIGYAAMIVAPVWWLGHFSSRATAQLYLALFAHAAAVVLASIPVAVAACWVLGRFRVLGGALIAAIVWLVMIVPATQGFWSSTTFLRGAAIADTLEFLGTLPLIVWLLTRLSSNNALERSVTRV